MKAVSKFISRFMAVIVLAVAALALFVPKSCLWIWGEKLWPSFSPRSPYFFSILFSYLHSR